MLAGKLGFCNFDRSNLVKLAAATLLLTGFVGFSTPGQQPGQKTFASPEEASKAMFAAAKNNDQKALLDLLGPAGKEIISSGDAAEDTENRENFAKRYQEMNRLVKEPDGTVTMYIGAHNWPCPIPLVNKGKLWYFDAETGKREILFRRIGRNEISAIHVCQQLAMAQKEYYAQHHNEYAMKIRSDEGKENGLYWKTGDNQPASPIGPLVAQAVSDDGAGGSSSAIPYRGYYFHSLKGQGKNAPGGAKTYMVDGKMTGFAFVAYPAEYRSSGVKAFLVTVDGVVYEKDLGKKTETIAKTMREYNLGTGWQPAMDEPQQAASDVPAQ